MIGANSIYYFSNYFHNTIAQFKYFVYLCIIKLKQMKTIQLNKNDRDFMQFKRNSMELTDIDAEKSRQRAIEWLNKNRK